MDRHIGKLEQVIHPTIPSLGSAKAARSATAHHLTRPEPLQAKDQDKADATYHPAFTNSHTNPCVNYGDSTWQSSSPRVNAGGLSPKRTRASLVAFMLSFCP